MGVGGYRRKLGPVTKESDLEKGADAKKRRTRRKSGGGGGGEVGCSHLQMLHF